MKYLKSTFAIISLLVLSVVLIGCSQSETGYELSNVKNAHITLDINPSIEIITSDDGLVEQVNGLNDDAIKLLVDTNFIGQTVEDTIDAILQLAIELGYIEMELENAILITTTSTTPEETEELENKVSQKVQDFINERKMNIEILKASLSATTDIKEVAKQYHISVGKVKLITYALAADKELTFEVAAEMSVRDLNRVIKEYRNETREFYSEEIIKKYVELKQQFHMGFELELKAFLNTQIQLAADEMFAEILKDSEATVGDIKALYQEYYDKLLLVEIPVVDSDDDDDDDDDEYTFETHERLEELKALKEQLQKEYEQLIDKLRDNDSEDLTKEEIDAILVRLKEVAVARSEVKFDINELKETVRNGHGYRFGFDENKTKKYLEVKFDDDLEDLYENLEEEYEDLFEDLDVDLEDLEEIFEEAFEAEIEELKLTTRAEIKAIQEQFKNDSKAILEQIKEEKQILKHVWKK